jgi:hypothetical protein
MSMDVDPLLPHTWPTGRQIYRYMLDRAADLEWECGDEAQASAIRDAAARFRNSELRFLPPIV